MTRKMIGGVAALGIVGAISTLLAPGAMAQGYGYRSWHDGYAIRQDMRVVRGEDHRIAARSRGLAARLLHRQSFRRGAGS